MTPYAETRFRCFAEHSLAVHPICKLIWATTRLGEANSYQSMPSAHLHRPSPAVPAQARDQTSIRPVSLNRPPANKSHERLVTSPGQPASHAAQSSFLATCHPFAHEIRPRPSLSTPAGKAVTAREEVVSTPACPLPGSCNTLRSFTLAKSYFSLPSDPSTRAS